MRRESTDPIPEAVEIKLRRVRESTEDSTEAGPTAERRPGLPPEPSEAPRGDATPAEDGAARR